MHVITAKKNIFPIRTRKTSYNAFIRPDLDYTVEVWEGKARMTKLQKNHKGLKTAKPLLYGIF